MDEIEKAGLNHVREELEQASTVTGMSIERTIDIYMFICYQPMTATEVAESLRKTFERIGAK